LTNKKELYTPKQLTKCGCHRFIYNLLAFFCTDFPSPYHSHVIIQTHKLKFYYKQKHRTLHKKTKDHITLHYFPKMNRLTSRTLVLSLLFASNNAFSPVIAPKKVPFFANRITETPSPQQASSTAIMDSTAASSVALDSSSETTTQDNIVKDEQPVAPPAASSPDKKNLKKKKDASGIFAPAVLLTKDIVGDAKLNKLRAKIIGLHSDVIGKFTATAQTEFGNQILKLLFQLADKDGNGEIDEEELTIALGALGFDFLKEKQIAGIFKRADGDNNGKLDFEEWEKEAPKTLKTALTKLAKKNGHDLGFLA
jgi:hypothetical protein